MITLEKKAKRIIIYNEKTDNKGLLAKYLHEGYEVVKPPNDRDKQKVSK